MSTWQTTDWSLFSKQRRTIYKIWPLIFTPGPVYLASPCAAVIYIPGPILPGSKLPPVLTVTGLGLQSYVKLSLVSYSIISLAQAKAYTVHFYLSWNRHNVVFIFNKIMLSKQCSGSFQNIPNLFVYQTSII
jgi:hypothetical protein